MSESPTPTVNPQYLPPDLAEFIQRRMRDISANINSCLIGTITAINSNATVTVAISFQKIIKGVVPILNSNTMADQILNYPALVNVPVFLYQGGGTYIKMPIAINDPCIILFCDRDMDNWFQSGQLAPPNSDRVHSINDAIAIVGINNLQSPLSIPASPLIQIVDRTGERLCQSGFLQPYAGSSSPSGWLLCSGQSISKNTYPDLFAIIGYTYGGSGDNFNVPDMRGQVAVGIGGTLGLTLGQEFGEITHLLTGPESGIQAHSHIIDAGNTGSGGALGNGDWTPSPYTNTETTGPTDAQTPHNNVQPSLGVNWIIKI